MELSDLKNLLWMWLALPLTALDWAIAWSRVPERVAMKFGPNGQPTSWAPRAGAMKVDLGLLFGVLLFATVIGALGIFQRPWKSKTMTIAVTCVSGFVFLVVNWILWAYHVP